MLREEFLRIFTPCCGAVRARDYWSGVEEAYTSRKRFYHNRDHLNFVFDQLVRWRSVIEEWDTMILAVTYHDYVYDPQKSDNEEQSASEAVRVCTSIGLSL